MRRYHCQCSSYFISKILLRFLPFPDRVENKKCHGSLTVVKHFQIGIRDYYRGTRATTTKMCETIGGGGGLSHNLVFLFQVENGLHGKSENIKYLWHYASDFLFSPCACENNGLLNKNDWDDIDIID